MAPVVLQALARARWGPAAPDPRFGPEGASSSNAGRAEIAWTGAEKSIRRGWAYPHEPAVAYGGKGTPPGTAPTHNPPAGATRTPTPPAQAPQAQTRTPTEPAPAAAGIPGPTIGGKPA
ncbi:hypothetical protein GCM10022233_52960 [Streptomyces shaanxiensis]|uniref:Uncharacterized protein n=1 Tax=Streptomyces shaanxiensis TaxID=653357 RepID=A0ABP7VLS4_9ACTN